MIQLSTVCVSHGSVYTFLALVTQSELIVVYTPIIPVRGLPIEKGLRKGAWMRESYAKKKMKVCAYPWSYLAVTRIPELPWESQRFLHFLKKHGKPFT